MLERSVHHSYILSINRYRTNTAQPQFFCNPILGKLKRLKEAKQEAITEIEIEKNEREKQYKTREDEVRLLHPFFLRFL